MKKERLTAVCPLCGKTYHEHPALSRTDNITLICPDCGTRQALSTLKIGKEEQDEILAIIHRHIENCRDGGES